MQSPELSPDGTRVATKLAISGTQVLAILKLQNPEKTPPPLIN
jgi:hypothetical protein